MHGIVYNSANSRTKIRELIEYLYNNKLESNLGIIKIESFSKLLPNCFTHKIKFIHVFNPTKTEIRILKLISSFYQRKLVFSFEDEKNYENVARVLKNDIVLIESKEALNYFKSDFESSLEVFLVKPYRDSNVYVASGAKQ